MRKLILIIVLISIATGLNQLGFCSTKFYEKDYQRFWCDANRGELEVILSDKTRVDCVTETHAIEFDFAKKWGESIGQALYYGLSLGKQPGIVLILENKNNDVRYLDRVKKVAREHDITVWTITPEDLLLSETKNKNK